MILEHKFDLPRKSRDLQATAKVHLANIRLANISDTGTIKDVLHAQEIKNSVIQLKMLTLCNNTG